MTSERIVEPTGNQRARESRRRPRRTPAAAGGGFVFAYDPATLSELEHAAGGPSR